MAEQSAHFAFGENWQSFAQVVTDQRVKNAQADLLKLFPNGELVGKPFFDIGCGSGLSMLAALNLGASEANGIDIDANSVSAARSLLTKFAPARNWRVEQRSVFDLAPAIDGTKPIVHSWGVLHHTGDMRKAIDNAAAMVAPNGILTIAIYRRTLCCPFWKVEKKIYSQATKPVQFVISSAYKSAFVAYLALRGRNPISYIKSYVTARGMDWSHDVHDWLGGYPYESSNHTEMIKQLSDLGFSVRTTSKASRQIGLFGSGCDEYVATKIKAAHA